MRDVSGKRFIWMLPSHACPQCCCAAVTGQWESPMSPLPMPGGDTQCGVGRGARPPPREALPAPRPRCPGWLCSAVSWQPLALGGQERHSAHLGLSPSPAPLTSWIWGGNRLLLDCVAWVLTLGSADIPYQLRLPLSRPQDERAVWSYTAAALHLPLTRFLSVPWLL